MPWFNIVVDVVSVVVPMAVAWHYRDIARAERARAAYWASMYNRREADKHG